MSHELLDAIDEVKDKLSDSEYKNIVELIAKIHKNIPLAGSMNHVIYLPDPSVRFLANQLQKEIENYRYYGIFTTGLILFFTFEAILFGVARNMKND